MGKTKIKISYKNLKWVKELSDPSLVCEGDTVTCQRCNKQITCARKSQLQQHLNTKVHKENLNFRNKVYDLVEPSSNLVAQKNNEFFMDLCNAMIAIKLPWRTLDNETWRNFLQKYMDRTIPNESTVRKNYLNACYLLAISKIKTDIGENCVWISVDETTDSSGRLIANLIVGKLCEQERSTPHLLASKQLKKTNADNVARFINTALRILWPNGDNDSRVLLLVTDAAAYMLKAGESLRTFYQNMIHLTCLAHGINRVAEQVRVFYPSVDTLISSVKKIFLKAQLRAERYKEIMIDAPMPPEPILTRWGTWLEAAVFYANSFQEIKEVIMSFDAGDSVCIASAQEVFKNKTIVQDLMYIKTHFGNLPNCIQKLEAKGMPLTESMQVVSDVVAGLRFAPGACGKIVSNKIDAVLKRNPSFEEVSIVAQILSGDNHVKTNEIAEQFWSKFKFAPVTSCDVERSFSAFKLIFTDKRHQFCIQNLEKTLVVYCNLNYS